MDHSEVEAEKRQAMLMLAFKVAACDVCFQMFHKVALWKWVVHFPLSRERPVQSLRVARSKTGALNVE